MMVAADYARAVAYLDRSRLPAYVSFVESASARGITHGYDGPQRVYVRISDGAIVQGVPPSNVHVVQTGQSDSDNPFGKHEFFQPACYVPLSEDRTNWNGLPAVRFKLRGTCGNDAGISELYADPQTLRPIAADGNVPDTDSHMTVALELRYTTVDGYSVPSSLSAHAVGHGWLFWARERGQVDYSEYEFFSQPQFTRRQSAKP